MYDEKEFKSTIMAKKLRLIIAVFVVTILILPALSAGEENPCSFSGYLWGTGARTTFEVYSDKEELVMVFNWPAGTTDFWVTVMDREKKEILVDRSLNDGDVFTLTGPGIFYFEIYSHWGNGCWSADIEKNK